MTNLSLTKTYTKYPKYKDSGVEWLGEIPEAWEAKKLQRLFTRVKRAGYINEELLSVYRDHGVIPKSSREDNFNKEADDLSAYQLVDIGDLAINKMKAWQGSLAISGYRGIVSPAYYIAKPVSNHHGRFLHYLLRSDVYIQQYQINSGGVRNDQWDLDYERFRKIEAILPPNEEQERIARFLDERTARIDEIIAKKERLIELLKEKRTATINHAVTKGIDPNAELVDSGVEWIGKIPKGWGVDRLKDISAYCSRGGTPDYSENEDGYKFINQSCVRDGFVDLDKIKFSKTESRKGCVRKGDILINSTGTGTLGRLSVFDQSDAYFADTHITIYRTEKAYSRFVMYVIQHPAWQNYLYASSVSGSTNQIELSRNKLLEIPVIIPSRKEQINIAEYLDKQSSSFSQVIKGIERSIELLKEFKSSLISHAVTGKIKV